MENNLIKYGESKLKENRIEDITFLTNLINIKSIDLSSNNIQTVPNLYELKKLQLINISLFPRNLIKTNLFSRFSSKKLMSTTLCLVKSTYRPRSKTII